jgi:hypothetical protein
MVIREMLMQSNPSPGPSERKSVEPMAAVTPTPVTQRYSQWPLALK